jgi:hypothetical protein
MHSLNLRVVGGDVSSIHSSILSKFIKECECAIGSMQRSSRYKLPQVFFFSKLKKTFNPTLEFMWWGVLLPCFRLFRVLGFHNLLGWNSNSNHQVS